MEQASLQQEHVEGGRDAGSAASRRQVVLGATAALAGCAALCGAGAQSAAAATVPEAAAPSAALSGAALPENALAAAKPLVKLSALAIGRSVKVGTVIVTRTGRSTVVGHSTVCTHMGCTVAPSGAELHCPCHGSRFNARTGAVLGGPAPRPLPAIRLALRQGYVYRT